MNKKEFNKLFKEATTEYKDSKKERVKQLLKDRMEEYEMAKATVLRLEKGFKEIQKNGINDGDLLLDYDD